MNRQGTASMTAAPRIVIVGASARALAQSAHAAGWEVHAADLFGDADLRASCGGVTRIDPRDYPAGLATAAAALPPGPWCYTGAIENAPLVIDAIAATRPLAGNAAAVVRAVRDPFRLSRACAAAGLRFPETHPAPAGLPVDGSFLVKPIASAGGRGIRPWSPPTAGRDARQPRVWQRRILGVSHSAAFVIDRTGPRLLGLTRQLIGEPWCHAGPFAYCGAVVIPPPEVPRPCVADLARLGDVLAGHFHLVGAIGVDVVVAADGRPWIIEVNPRYTASMELHERTSRESVAAAHVQACGFGRAEPRAHRPPSVTPVWAKAVLHAPHAIDVTAALLDDWRRQSAPWAAADDDLPVLADIPSPGQTMRRGSPVVTVFAAAATPALAVAEVAARAAALLAVSRPSAAEPSPPPPARCTA